MDIYETCMDISYNRFKTLLVFGTLDLIFKVIVLYIGYLPLDRFLEICRCRDKLKS